MAGNSYHAPFNPQNAATGLPIVALAMGSTITSNPIILERSTCAAVECFWSGGGSPSGTLKLQASNSIALSTITPNTVATWTDITGQTSTVSTNSGSVIFDITKTGNYAIRLVYTFTSGTANLTVVATTKNQ